MPRHSQVTHEPLCLGNCGRTVRETVDNCGICRKCLAKADPNDRRLKLKRTPDSILLSAESSHTLLISKEKEEEMEAAIQQLTHRILIGVDARAAEVEMVERLRRRQKSVTPILTPST